jgi:hypothetical protein
MSSHLCEFGGAFRVTAIASHDHYRNIGKVVIGPSEELMDLPSIEPVIEKNQVWTDSLDDIQRIQRVIGPKNFPAISLSQLLYFGVNADCNNSL